MNESELIERALFSRKFSWSPYSRFSVGAALLAKNNKVYTGCNIEFSSYTPTVCAERVALLKAVSCGETEFEAIAVVGGMSDEDPFNLKEFVTPCGVCRQSLSEFCDDQFRIILAKNTTETKTFYLWQLFPMRFSYNPKR